MTTIAYRNGVLAADSMSCHGNAVLSLNTVKVWKTHDGLLIAGSGDACSIRPLINWIMQHDRQGERPTLDKECGGVVGVGRNEDGKIIVRRYEHIGFIEFIEPEFLAFGAGSEAAMAAMHMGAGAEKAVEIAMLVSLGTGGRVMSVALD